MADLRSTNWVWAMALAAGTACGGEPTAGPNSAGVSIEVMPPVVWPNEPAALSGRSDQPFDQLAGLGWDWPAIVPGVVRIVDDPSAPLSPPHVLRFDYRPGFSGGGAPGLVDYPHSGSPEVYAGFWWKPSEPWQNHPSNVNKLAFWQTATWGSSADIQMYGPAPYQLHVVTQFRSGTARLQPNINQTAVTLGTWHRIEWHLKYASSAGADGLVEWWLDGVLQGRYTNLRTPGDQGFTVFQFSPTWGGVGGTKNQDDYFLFDHVRISTR